MSRPHQIMEGDELTDRRYQCQVEKLFYLSYTIPDVAYVAGIITKFTHQPHADHMDATLIRIIQYLRAKNHCRSIDISKFMDIPIQIAHTKLAIFRSFTDVLGKLSIRKMYTSRTFHSQWHTHKRKKKEKRVLFQKNEKKNMLLGEKLNYKRRLLLLSLYMSSDDGHQWEKKHFQLKQKERESFYDCASKLWRPS